MSLPDDIFERFTTVGETDARRLAMWAEGWLHRPEYVLRTLTLFETMAAECRRELPGLIRHAAAWRSDRSSVLVTAKTLEHEEQERIFRDAMRATQTRSEYLLTPRPYKAVVIATTDVGLRPADTIFGDTVSAVIPMAALDDWERERGIGYSLVRSWYNVGVFDVGPPGNSELSGVDSPSAGAEYWCLRAFVRGASGSDYTYRWDGRQAVLLGEGRWV